MMRPGARSSSVENVLASRAGLRVQMSITPLPTLIVLGGRGERGHRHHRVAHQPAVGLPHRGEALLLGVPDEIDPVADRVRVLQVQRNGDGAVGHGRRCWPWVRELSSSAARHRAHQRRSNSRVACSAALARTSSRSTRVGRPSRSSTSPSAATTSSARMPGRERDVPRRVDVVVAPRHAIILARPGRTGSPHAATPMRCPATP